MLVILITALALVHLSAATTAKNAPFPCTLCWAAINELESLLAEDATQAEITKTLDKNICARFHSPLCNEIVQYGLPAVARLLEQNYHVGAVCQELGMCSKPDFNQPDKTAIPVYTLDLDLPPQQRWTKLMQLPHFHTNVNRMLNIVENALPLFAKKSIDALGAIVLRSLTLEYQGELAGIAKALGADINLLAVAQVAYDVTDGCTSIVANSASAGHPLHVRNLDFGAGLGFTDTLRNLTVQVEYQKSGKTLFKSVGYASYIGVLTGMRPNGWTATIDTRFMTANPIEMFIEEINEFNKYNKTVSMPTHLLRETFVNVASYASAVQTLEATPLVSSVYFIVGGTQTGEGVVIARGQNGPDNVSPIGTIKPDWAIVQTNYDWWNKNASLYNFMPSPQNPNVPILDNRREAALIGLRALPAASVTFPRLLNIMDTKPVFNQLTTYTVAMSAADSHFSVVRRYCNSPCPF